MFLTPPYLAQAALAVMKDVAFTPWKLPAGCVCEKDGRPKPECRGEPKAIGRPQPKICSGVIATGDTFIADVTFAAALADSRKAVAADMETAAVAQEATDRGIPFLAVRVISDVVHEAGESLYYCLKPMAGLRLASVMAKVIPVVDSALRSDELRAAAPENTYVLDPANPASADDA